MNLLYDGAPCMYLLHSPLCVKIVNFLLTCNFKNISPVTHKDFECIFLTYHAYIYNCDINSKQNFLIFCPRIKFTIYPFEVIGVKLIRLSIQPVNTTLVCK